MGTLNKVAMVALCALVAGCAGRQAQPVPITMYYDSGLSCDQIQAEIKRNEQTAVQLAGDSARAQAANIAVGVVGVLVFWPALFALDLTDAQTQEMNALRARNTHLATLADVHGCNGQAAAAPPQGAAPPPAASPPQQPQAAAAPTPPSASAVHWIGQASHDSCDKPYAIDVAVDAGWLKGHVRRDNADYIVNIKLNQQGNLDHALMPLADPGSAPAAPRSIDLKINFSDQDATGGYSTFDGKAYGCTTALTLARA